MFRSIKQKSVVVGDRLVALYASPKRYAYVGGQGHANLGDNAMFWAAQKLLSDSQVFSYGTSQGENNLARLGLSGHWYFSAAILGGGTLINPPGCGLWMEQVRCALRQDLPIWSFGTGVGSCGFTQPNNVSLHEWQPLLENFREIGVRGPRSEKALRQLGIEQVQITGDVALAWAQDRGEPLLKKPKVAVNLTIPHGQNIEAYASLMHVCNITTELVRQGWDVVPVAMHWMDRRPLRQFLRHLPGDWAIFYPQTVEEFFAKVAPCTFAISVRLHMAVLACCVGVPPLKIAYREKCLDFMEAMGLAHWCVPLEVPDIIVMAEKVDQLAASTNEMRADVLARAQNWKRKLQDFVHKMTT